MRTTTTPKTIMVAISLQNGDVYFMAIVTQGEFADGPRTIAPTPEYIQREINRCPWASDVVRWRVIEHADVPTDRTYRGALTDNHGSLEVRMPVAREIHRGRLRRYREPLLAQLDVQYQRADEGSPGPDTAARKEAVSRQKQVLRDLPQDPRIETAETVEELLALWPEGLPQ